MCVLQNKSLQNLLTISFINVYSYLTLNEEESITKKCIDFVTQKTITSVTGHLQADSRVIRTYLS